MNLKAERRLKEVLSFWHKAADSYQDVDEFVINLNACIQTSRNVTFILQNQKVEIHDFHSWYDCDWQIALKNDPIMKWCNDARVTIVHQEDLAIHSVARASIHNNYLFESIISDIAVDPMVEMSEVAIALSKKIPEQHKENSFIRLERQWKVEGLEIELLSALAHVLTVLTALIRDVDDRKGSSSIYNLPNSGPEKIDHETIKELIEEHSPECMQRFEDYRVAWFKLPNLEQYNFEENTEEFKSSDIETSKKHYKYTDLEKLFLKLSKVPTFSEKIDAFANIAKQMLQTDGYHIKLVILLFRSGGIELVTTEFQEQSDKYVFWHKMAKKVRRKGAKELISIGEAWVYSLDDKIKYADPSLIPNKKEVLLISGVSETGACVVIQIPFSRKESRIVFAEQQISYETPNNLLSITKVWKKDRRFKKYVL